MNGSTLRFQAAAASLLLCLSGSARGEFVNNYGEWRKLSELVQLGYAMGAFDQIYGLGKQAAVPGVNDCVRAIGLNTKMAVQLINKYYADHTDAWSETPAHVFNQASFEACKPYLEKYNPSR
jgi:hypothetical protein